MKGNINVLCSNNSRNLLPEIKKRKYSLLLRNVNKQKHPTSNHVIIPTLSLYSLPKQNIPRWNTSLVISLVQNKQRKPHGHDIWKVLILPGATTLFPLFSAQMYRASDTAQMTVLTFSFNFENFTIPQEIKYRLMCFVFITFKFM